MLGNFYEKVGYTFLKRFVLCSVFIYILLCDFAEPDRT